MASRVHHAAPAALETPSGKGARDENFPVGSFLLPAALRPHVQAFYAFVRAADDIADNPELAPEDKIARLKQFARALTGSDAAAAALPKALALRASLAATGVSPQHALDLLAAFTQDATKLRYRDLADLLGYCALSARPVGRQLLDLHGEAKALYAFSDPLCDALQVLNHLQDCQADYRNLDRVYLPLDRFAAAGIGVEALDRAGASPALRRVLDDTLAGVDQLLAAAADLPRALASRRLAAESAVILAIARRLARELRRRDPLAERVELGRPAFVYCALQGLAGLPWTRRPPVACGRRTRHASDDRVAPARRSARPRSMPRPVGRMPRRWSRPPGTSFYWSMRLLPRAKRDAMYAIYAFCREVDDIADGDAAAGGQARASSPTGGPRSRRCSRAARAGRPRWRWSSRSAASICPGPSSTR